MTDAVDYATFSPAAPDAVWQEVARLFVECFSAAPYFEEPGELETIMEWGPKQLRHSGGRLVTARFDDRLVGFALAHGLRDDPSWQGILSQLAGETDIAAAALERPERAVIVHELAVREWARGRGIAGGCLALLLRDRTEEQTFIGVYERATDAASMYRHWQLTDIGRVPMPNGAIALHVLTARTADVAARVGRSRVEGTRSQR